MRKIILLTLLTTSYLLSSAQSELWDRDLSELVTEVNWVSQTEDGTVIVSGTEGMVGLDPASGKMKWHNKEIVAQKKSSFQTVDGLPLFFLDTKPIIGKNRSILASAITGEVLFDTKEGDYKIDGYQPIIEQGAILFRLISEGERFIMKFSLKTWKKDWIASVGKNKVGLVAKINNRGKFLDHGPIFTGDGTMIIGIKSDIRAFNFETGEQTWLSENKKDVKALVYSDQNNSLYMGIRGSKKLTVLNPQSGEDITPGKLKLRGTMLDVVEDEKGNLILVETEGFNLIEPATNGLIWKKSYKIEYLDEVIPYKDSFLAIGKNDKKGSSVHMVDEFGKNVWDSKVKGYSYYVTPTDQGVLYISTERANILNFSDGKDLWKRDVKFKAIPAVAFDSELNKVVLFENKTGYRFDLNDGSIDVFAEDIELAGVNKKTPLLAEDTPDGYFLYTDEHSSLLGRDGNLIYTNYFKPAQGFDFGLLAVAAQIGAFYLGVDFDIIGAYENLEKLRAIAQGASAGGKEGLLNAATTAMELYGGPAIADLSVTFGNIQTRISAGFEFNPSQFLSSAVDGQNFIYNINKSTGEVGTSIPLSNVKDFHIDEIGGKAFLGEGGNIKAFEL